MDGRGQKHRQTSRATGTAVHTTCTLLLLVGVSHLHSSLTSEARASYIHTRRRLLHAAEPLGSCFCAQFFQPVRPCLSGFCSLWPAGLVDILMSDNRVGIKATFSVRGQPVHEFSSSGATESPAPAAAGIGEQVTWATPSHLFVPVVPPQTCNV